MYGKKHFQMNSFLGLDLHFEGPFRLLYHVDKNTVIKNKKWTRIYNWIRLKAKC